MLVAGGAYLDGQLPVFRGFNRSLVFLNGNEDHYTQYFSMLSGYDLTQDTAPAIGMNGTYGTFMYSHTCTLDFPPSFFATIAPSN